MSKYNTILPMLQRMVIDKRAFLFMLGDFKDCDDMEDRAFGRGNEYGQVTEYMIEAALTGDISIRKCYEICTNPMFYEFCLDTYDEDSALFAFVFVCYIVDKAEVRSEFLLKLYHDKVSKGDFENVFNLCIKWIIDRLKVFYD